MQTDKFSEDETKIYSHVESMILSHPEGLRKKMFSAKTKIDITVGTNKLAGEQAGGKNSWVELLVPAPAEMGNSIFGIQFVDVDGRGQITIIPDEAHVDLYQKYVATDYAEVAELEYIFIHPGHPEYDTFTNYICTQLQ